MKILRGLKAFVAGVALLALTGAVSAQTEVPGVYTFGGSGTGSLAPTGTWQLFGSAGGNRRFTPAIPLEFGDITYIGMDFILLDSTPPSTIIGGGSPRVTFRLDMNGDLTEDGRIIADFQYIDSIGFTHPVGPQTTGNIVALDQPAGGAFERVDGGITVGAGGRYNYPEFINQVGTTGLFNGVRVGDYKILDLFVADDTPNLDVEFSNFSIQIPEPASLGLLAIGAGAMLMRRKRA
jgi:hypothetical protein